MIGPWEILLILVVVLVIFGAGRLPTVMGDVAKGVKAFKAGLKDEDTAQQKPSDAPPAQITQARASDAAQTQKTDEHRF